MFSSRSSSPLLPISTLDLAPSPPPALRYPRQPVVSALASEVDGDYEMVKLDKPDLNSVPSFSSFQLGPLISHPQVASPDSARPVCGDEKAKDGAAKKVVEVMGEEDQAAAGLSLDIAGTATEATIGMGLLAAGGMGIYHSQKLAQDLGWEFEHAQALVSTVVGGAGIGGGLKTLHSALDRDCQRRLRAAEQQLKDVKADEKQRHAEEGTLTSRPDMLLATSDSPTAEL